MERSAYPTRVCRLGEEENVERDTLSAAERMAMVWPLTVQLWAFRGGDPESPMRRDITRVMRRGDDEPPAD